MQLLKHLGPTNNWQTNICVEGASLPGSFSLSFRSDLIQRILVWAYITTKKFNLTVKVCCSTYTVFNPENRKESLSTPKYTSEHGYKLTAQVIVVVSLSLVFKLEVI